MVISSGTNFCGHFAGCTSLNGLDVSAWDLSSGTDFSFQFQNCTSLSSLDVSTWDLGLGTNFSFQFNNLWSVNGNLSREGTNIDSDVFVHESLNGGDQGNLASLIFKNVNGFTENTSQSMEMSVSSPGAANYYLLGL